MNGITYNRFNSPYEGDKTKDCALSVAEMDNNFYVLEGRDITSVEVNGDELVINLLNGNKISNKDAFSEFTKNLSFEFDSENGVLTISRNDEVYEICGFVTENELSKIKGHSDSTNETIIGDGTPKAPLGIDPSYKTGQYRPVKAIIDNCGCGCGCGKSKNTLPKDAKVGDRYITVEKVNDYGFLYPFEGVRKLVCDLKDAGYEWDLPTKGDWDNMLNAIEPKAEWANHNEVTTHKYLGKKAGQFLKAREGWKLEDKTCDCDCSYDESDCDCCNCAETHSSCYSQPVCGEQGSCKHPSNRHPNQGIDKYGFAVLPAGFADEEKNYMYYTERAYFWTKTNSGYGAYIKRFDFDSSKVYQDTMDLDCYASVRLVKKYDGSNFNSAEEIFGESYPAVLVPSKDGGSTIWISLNLQLNNRGYKPLAIPVDDIVCETRYYINEWNGSAWKKNTLKEGDSVVVINAPQDKVSDEYRIIGGVLTRVNEVIFNDVMEAVEGELAEMKETILNIVDEKVNKLEEEDRRISASLEQETNDRIAEDNKIQENLKTETENRIMVDNQQWAVINNEIATREDEDHKIQENLKTETENRIMVDNQQWAVINNEIERAKAREDEIEAQIPTEGEYDEAEGKLSLKREGEEKFSVQFSYNFGEF